MKITSTEEDNSELGFPYSFSKKLLGQRQNNVDVRNLISASLLGQIEMRNSVYFELQVQFIHSIEENKQLPWASFGLVKYF